MNSLLLRVRGRHRVDGPGDHRVEGARRAEAAADEHEGGQQHQPQPDPGQVRVHVRLPGAARLLLYAYHSVSAAPRIPNPQSRVPRQCILIAPCAQWLNWPADTITQRSASPPAITITGAIGVC